MFRRVLTAVLMSFVSLPHGVCFCHVLHAAPTQPEPVCCEAIPTESDSQPNDESDEHEKNCSCMLSEVPALQRSLSATSEFDKSVWCFLLNVESVASKADSSLDPAPSERFTSLDEPIPLIVRALRI